MLETSRRPGSVRHELGLVLAGGGTDSGPGFWYRPTVVAGALQSDEIEKKEVFGPVVTVTRSRTTTRRSAGRTTSITDSPRRSSPRT